MSAGARFFRPAPPHLGCAVMTRSSVAGRVVDRDLSTGRVLVAFSPSDARWYDASQLYDATHLVWFGIALELHAAGDRLEYVIPGCGAPFRVMDLVDGEHPLVVLVGGGKVYVDPRAPRFLVVR